MNALNDLLEQCHDKRHTLLATGNLQVDCGASLQLVVVLLP